MTGLPLIVIALLATTVSFSVSLSVPANDKCNTAECKEAAKHILSKIDTTIDPCDDFYQFACGKFLADNANKSVNAFMEVGEVMIEHVSLVLSQLDQNSPQYFHHLKNYLKHCLDQGEK